MGTALPDFDTFWDYDNPTSTEERFREVLPAARSSGDPSYVAQLLTQIARAQGLQREFDAAHETLDEVAAMLDRAGPVARVRYLLERGRALNSSGRAAEARPLFLEVWDLGRESGADFFAVDAAHMVAIIEPAESALEWNERALDLARRSAEPRAQGWQGSLLNNLGWAYFDLGRHGRALEIFQQALAWREAHGQPREVRIARWCIGRTLRALGRVAEALDLQRALLAEREGTDEPGGYTFEEIGECLLALDRADEARPMFARAHAELSKDPWLAANEPRRLERIKTLAGG